MQLQWRCSSKWLTRNSPLRNSLLRSKYKETAYIQLGDPLQCELKNVVHSKLLKSPVSCPLSPVCLSVLSLSHVSSLTTSVPCLTSLVSYLISPVCFTCPVLCLLSSFLLSVSHLLPVSCLLSVSHFLYVACLPHVCCLSYGSSLSQVSCLTSPVCLLSLNSCLLSHIDCLSHISCMSYASCLSHVSYLSPVCHMSHVSCLTHIYCLTSPSQLGWNWPVTGYQWDAKKSYRFDLYHWSQLADLRNLAVLVLLADLADWTPFFV